MSARFSSAAPESVRKPRATELPSGVKLQPGMIGRHVTLRLQNGWLLGFDAGEFGGGLWFAGFDGKAKSFLRRTFTDS